MAKEYLLVDGKLVKADTKLVRVPDTENLNDLADENGAYATQSEEVANEIEELIVKNGVIDGSPKGVYANLSALQTAFPSGASGVYLTSDNGHWYYWNGSAWTDGGVYQRSEDINKLKEDLIQLETKTENELNSLKEEFNDYEKVSLDIKHDGFYNRYGGFQTGEGRSYAILTVNPNEQYKLKSFISSVNIPAIIYKNDSGTVINYEKLGNGMAEVLSDYEFIIPENCVTLIVQSSSYDYELSLKKYSDEYRNKTVIHKKSITVKLGSELLSVEPSVVRSGWSGSITEGFTHESGYSGEIEFRYGGIIDLGEDYIFEFDTNYVEDEFMTVGIGNSYKILAYNGTGHIILPLKAIDSHVLYIKPYTNANFTISNLSLKRICDNGTEKVLEVYSTMPFSSVNNYGFWNVVFGEHALTKAVGSTRTIAIGNGALGELQGGHRNIGIGTFAMSQMTGGEMNVSVGADSMFTVKGANGCIAIGKGAMHSGANLSHNIAIGNGSLCGGSDSESSFNIALGYNSGYGCKGERNIFMGYNNAMEVSQGIANVYIGDQCTGVNGKNQNTVIGASAKATGEANRSIAIGYQAQTTKENQCVIGGTNITEFVFGNKKINFNTDGTVTWETI